HGAQGGEKNPQNHREVGDQEDRADRRRQRNESIDQRPDENPTERERDRQPGASQQGRASSPRDKIEQASPQGSRDDRWSAHIIPARFRSAHSMPRHPITSANR